MATSASKRKVPAPDKSLSASPTKKTRVHSSSKDDDNSTLSDHVKDNHDEKKDEESTLSGSESGGKQKDHDGNKAGSAPSSEPTTPVRLSKLPNNSSGATWQAALEDVVPNPKPLPSSQSQQPIDIPRRAHFTEEFMVRVRALLAYSDATNEIYALSRMPSLATCNWRGRTRFSKDATFMARRGSQLPMKVWIVGELTSSYFYDDGTENPSKRVSVYMRPFLAADMYASERVHRLFLNDDPHQPPMGNTIRVGKWQTERRRGSSVRVATPFTALYDATAAFRSKSEMAQLPPSELMRGDVVLAEAYITRYHPGSVDDIRTQDLTKWRARFEMQSLSLLLRAPEFVEEVEDRESGFVI